MAAEQAPKRKSTQSGLGAVAGSGEHSTDTRHKTVELAAPEPPKPEATSSPRLTLPVPVEAEPRALITDSPEPPKVRSSSAPPASGRAKSREPRAAIAIDDVGAAALDAHSRPPRHGRPKVTKSRRELAAAPIDPRDAFLLSFIDGKLSVASLVDVSGMGEGEVMTILARLRRLGIIAYA